MAKITAAITGVGQYLPDYILTNDELSKMVDTSDEWIMSHIGVKTRHILKGEGVGTSYMGARAIINLLDKTGVDPMEVDLVICATVTPDMFFPSTGNLIADQAGCKNAFAYDVSAACSGFLFALTTGAKFIETGSCKKVVVVGADKMSSIIDYTDRSTCPIFGDGAAAVLLDPNTEGLGVTDEILHSDGSGGLQPGSQAGGPGRQPVLFGGLLQIEGEAAAGKLLLGVEGGKGKRRARGRKAQLAPGERRLRRVAELCRLLCRVVAYEQRQAVCVGETAASLIIELRGAGPGVDRRGDRDALPGGGVLPLASCQSDGGQEHCGANQSVHIVRIFLFRMWFAAHSATTSGKCFAQMSRRRSTEQSRVTLFFFFSMPSSLSSPCR